MYSVWVLAGIFFIWLLILSFLVLRQRNFLQSLFPRSGERDIRKKFEEILEEMGNFRKDLGRMEQNLSRYEDESLTHIQKVQLLRFNPYQETGGDQSFSIALLDRGGNGFVLTSLHARSGTRVFAKPVKKGEGMKYKLSSEEEEVLRRALSDE